MRRDGVIRKLCKRYNAPWEAHELTFTCFKGRAFLSKDRTRGYLADAIADARTRCFFHVWAYVFMPQHVHLLIKPTTQPYSISAILKSIKQSVARRAVAYLRSHNPAGLTLLATGQKHSPYRFWQDGGGYDRNITTTDVLFHSRKYIHDNPVEAGLAACPEDWVWSSYRDWRGIDEGPIPIDKQSFLQWMM